MAHGPLVITNFSITQIRDVNNNLITVAEILASLITDNEILTSFLVHFLVHYILAKTSLIKI